MTVLLSASRLTKSYGPRPLFVDLSLDLPGVLWLERLLRAAPFGYLVATHDRAFLRAVADEIIEVSRAYPTGAFRVAGSYDEFVDRRDEFLDAQARQEEAVANQVRKE